jgi:hypothetical protein
LPELREALGNRLSPRVAELAPGAGVVHGDLVGNEREGRARDGWTRQECGQRRDDLGHPAWQVLVAGVDAGRTQEIADEGAKLHGSAVCHEVDAAADTSLGCAQQTFDGVLDVTGRREVAAAVDPAPASITHGLRHGRQERGVPASPDEARPHDDGIEPFAGGRSHALFG